MREHDNDNGDDEAGEDDRAGDMDGGDAGTIRPVQEQRRLRRLTATC
jgi:hypothetical protein